MCGVYVYSMQACVGREDQMEHFKQHEHTHAHTQAPDIPGQYELRYYPAWLSGSYSGYRHEIYWAAKQFTVSGN